VDSTATKVPLNYLALSSLTAANSALSNLMDNSNSSNNNNNDRLTAFDPGQPG